MKNSKRFYFYIFIISILYAIQFYINNKITPVGDQTAFLKYAEEYQYNYLYFGIDRYFTWSSRLLIESATLLFSVHEKLFVVASALATFVLLLPSKKFSKELPWLPGFLLFICIPASEFLSAGSIPTYVNYIFPASFLLFSLYFRHSSNQWVKITSLLSFVFAVMQEQLAIYAFLWLVFELFRDWKINSDRNWNILFVVVASLGILSAKLSPGNAIRFIKNVDSWFPNFINLNSIQKVGLGILETGDGLLSVSFAFVTLFLIVSVILSIYKNNFTSFLLSTVVLLTVLSHKFEWRSVLFTLSAVSKVARESGTFEFNFVYFGAVLFYFIILFILLFIIWSLSDSKDKVWLSYLFIIGLLGRMVISFSPTLYASDTRTYLPIMLSVFIITCKFINVIYLRMKHIKIN